MAQTALVYVDGLSPGLLPMLSEGATCILQHRRKIVSGLYYFFFPIWQPSLATFPSKQNMMSSPSYCIPREGSIEAVAASSHLCLPLYFSFYMTCLMSMLYLSFSLHLPLSLPFKLGLIISCLLLFWPLPLSTHTSMQLPLNYTVSWSLQSSTE